MWLVLLISKDIGGTTKAFLEYLKLPFVLQKSLPNHRRRDQTHGVLDIVECSTN